MKRNISVILMQALLLLGLFATGADAKDSAEVIDIKVDEALETFKKEVNGADSFLESASGVLVFPSVLKAGFGIGGETGEGALRIDGETVEYYRTSAASIGLQFGAQSKMVVVVFMNADALKQFRDSSGWKAGVDGSIVLIEVGAAGALDTKNIRDPIVGFVLTNAGLMYNLTFEGSKYSKIDREPDKRTGSPR